ncbi:MAG TPA: hypothetical protein PLX10_01250 [Candidatus Paceibacterota bacterium]|nr:hypothetical protein [Candidatus Paceibacterota bacterium]
MVSNKNLFQQPFFWTSVCCLLALGILIGLYSYAWVSPTSSPNTSAGAAINFSGGNVGIGTTSPTSKLDINGNVGIRTGSGLLLYNPSNVDYATILLSDVNVVQANYPWNFSGSVGIGTSPSEKLEVAGNVKITGAGNGIKFADGTSQTTAATAGGTMSWPTSVKETTATHNGLFATSPANGYAAIETWIQTNGCSGYHVCMDWELAYAFGHINDALLCGDGTCTGRYNSGLYTEAGSTSYNSTDCAGWTSNDSNGWLKSPYWVNRAPSSLTSCSGTVSVLCCK